MRGKVLRTVLLVLALLLAVGCKDAYNAALANAAREGDVPAALKRIQSGAEVNASWFGKTPLHAAAAEGKLEMVQFLLDRGAEVNAVSEEQRTALDYATEKKHTDVVKLLKAHGGKRAGKLSK